MAEIFSQVFVIAVLIFYLGLLMGFLLWKLGRWLGSSGKKRAWPAILEHLSASRLFHPHYDAH
jgi:hypothetical protein